MILFTSDLMFGSKVLGAAKFAGLRGQGIRNRASLAQHVRVFAFAGHLQADRLRAAQAKIAPFGAKHEVHSRGSLSTRLVAILPPVVPAVPVAPVVPAAGGSS